MQLSGTYFDVFRCGQMQEVHVSFVLRQCIGNDLLLGITQHIILLPALKQEDFGTVILVMLFVGISWQDKRT